MRFPRTIALLALFLSVILIGSALAIPPQPILYGTTAGPTTAGSLYKIDPTTGSATLVGALLDSASNPYAVTGLAFDSLTGVIYGSTSTQSATGFSELVSINPASGLVTPIGLFNTGFVAGRPETMGDLTFDKVNSTLYGAGSLTANLYSINLLTGTASSVGASDISGTPRGVGLAATTSGTIFGTPDGSAGDFVTYSTADGSTTLINPLTGAPFPTGAINALALNASGTLFGLNVDQTNPARPTDLVMIDTVTGVITDIGATIANMDAIVFSEVPETSTWMAAALALGALAYTQCKRFARSRKIVVGS